jgi:hypothetical protein
VKCHLKRAADHFSTASALRLLDKSRIRIRIALGKKVRCGGGSADEITNTRTSDGENNLPEQKARLKVATSEPNGALHENQDENVSIKAFDANND